MTMMARLLFILLVKMAVANINRRFITSPHLPKPIAPYSPGVLVGNTLYISATSGRMGSSGDMIPGGIVPEAKQALINIGHILTAAGASYKDVVKVNVMLADIKDWKKFNEVYRQFFNAPYPARAMMQVAALPIPSSRLEIEAIAVLGHTTDLRDRDREETRRRPNRMHRY